MAETLKTGSRGADVGALQQQLVEAGYTIDGGDLALEAFGPSTEEALRAFQAAHVGPDHHALAVDGIAGEATRWALAHPSGQLGGGYLADGWRCDLAKAPAALVPVLRAATMDIGKKEDPDGSNDGPQLAKFKPAGRPWCALAVSTWLQELEGGSPIGVVAGVYTLMDWMKAHGKLLPDDFDASFTNDIPPTGVPLQPGDIFIIASITTAPDGKKLAHGHVGLVAADLGGGKFATIEGNAGNAVRGLIRSTAAISHFARLP